MKHAWSVARVWGAPGPYPVMRIGGEEIVLEFIWNEEDRMKWRAQGDDLRTFLGEFLSILPQIEMPRRLRL